ncbi:ATP-binding cassette domain-containing protein [Candidatus Liberibacter americanus]|uniref:ATP-binding cassette domain-containing protein n=1 Tax=Candidatus Liberibacter americanus TaxID=309868 RepID=UPI0002C602EF|nr:ATP-binding cassette domain-containing protein [Candidatus Liberibacter americanus]EMS36106.1 lipid A ABC exporter family, fused ATPase and inner membrane subunits [Candidatus Liberibacter americanus PW_SP]
MVNLPSVLSGKIAFRKVSFNFNNGLGKKHILKNIYLTISPGETVVLFGLSVVGKTIFLSLMLRHHNTCSGIIEFDDVNVLQLQQHEIRKNILLIPQKSVIMSETVHDKLL